MSKKLGYDPDDDEDDEDDDDEEDIFAYENEFDLPPPADIVAKALIARVESMIAEGFDPFDLIIGLNFVATTLAVQAKETWVPNAADYGIAEDVVLPDPEFQGSPEEKSTVNALEGKVAIVCLLDRDGSRWRKITGRLLCCWAILFGRR